MNEESTGGSTSPHLIADNASDQEKAAAFEWLRGIALGTPAAVNDRRSQRLAMVAMDEWHRCRELEESHPPSIGGNELADRLEKLAAEATPGPWAWDQRGEKVNEWSLGTAFDENEQPFSGRFTDENAIYDEYVCSHEAATCNYKDPALICELRNNVQQIIAALRSDGGAGMNPHGIERADWERRFLARIADRAVDEEERKLAPDAAADIGAAELESWPDGCEDWPYTLPEEAADEQMSNWSDDQEP